MKHCSYFHFAEEEQCAEEAALHSQWKSATWTCSKFSGLLLQFLMWNMSTLKIKPFCPWTTHLPVVMAHSPTDLVQHIHIYRAAQPYQQHMLALLLCQTRREADKLCFTWGFTAEQKWLFTVDTMLKGPQSLPRSSRLLFLTFTLSSCSHKSQLSHISCVV